MTELKPNKTIQPTSSLTLLLLAAFAMFFLSSCATLKKGDCVEGNWAGIGFNDAAAGLKADSQFRAHTKACSKFKISPNVGVYKAGYTKGLAKFCTTTNGFYYGANKSEYYGICPAGTQQGFLKGYLAGLDNATVELSKEISSLRHARRRAIHRHRGPKRHNNSGTKKTKKGRDRINSLELRIDSRRDDRRKLRRWHDFWATKLQ